MKIALPAIKRIFHLSREFLQEIFSGIPILPILIPAQADLCLRESLHQKLNFGNKDLRILMMSILLDLKRIFSKEKNWAEDCDPYPPTALTKKERLFNSSAYRIKLTRKISGFLWKEKKLFSLKIGNFLLILSI